MHKDVFTRDKMHFTREQLLMVVLLYSAAVIFSLCLLLWNIFLFIPFRCTRSPVPQVASGNNGAHFFLLILPLPGWPDKCI